MCELGIGWPVNKDSHTIQMRPDQDCQKIKKLTQGMSERQANKWFCTSEDGQAVIARERHYINKIKPYITNVQHAHRLQGHKYQCHKFMKGAASTHKRELDPSEERSDDLDIGWDPADWTSAVTGDEDWDAMYFTEDNPAEMDPAEFFTSESLDPYKLDEFDGAAHEDGMIDSSDSALDSSNSFDMYEKSANIDNDKDEEGTTSASTSISPSPLLGCVAGVLVILVVLVL